MVSLTMHPVIKMHLISVCCSQNCTCNVPLIAGHRVSYGYYRAFNVMLDHAQVLHDMAIKAAKGNRYRELKKGKLVNTNVKLMY